MLINPSCVKPKAAAGVAFDSRISFSNSRTYLSSAVEPIATVRTMDLGIRCALILSTSVVSNFLKFFLFAFASGLYALRSCIGVRRPCKSKETFFAVFYSLIYALY